MSTPIENFLDDTSPRLCVVPNTLRDSLMAQLDKALNGRPCSDHDRAILCGQLLAYFGQHGVIPVFELMEAV